MVLLDTLDEALALRSRVAAGLGVRRVDGPSGDWTMCDGALVNGAADYFRVIGRRTPSGDRLLLRQTEPALVALLVSGPPGKRRVLLNARAEPGLDGLCQFSTTVQSTPANYERRHGGRETPFLEVALGACEGPSEDDGARVIHDSRQYDWGQYYHLKTKRLRIVELPDHVEAPSPLVWVPADVLGEMLVHDQLATTDLRVAAVALAIVDGGRAAGSGSAGTVPTLPIPVLPVPTLPALGNADAFADVPLEDGSAWTINPRGIAAVDGSREIVWVRIDAASREVDAWVQPLMSVDAPLRTRLALRPGVGEPEVAVVAATRDGLDGRYLWYPAGPVGGTVVRSVAASAEGGRFLLHRVCLELVAGAGAPGATWLPLSAVESLVVTSLATSVELRLLIGLARLEGGLSG